MTIKEMERYAFNISFEKDKVTCDELINTLMKLTGYTVKHVTKDINNPYFCMYVEKIVEKTEIKNGLNESEDKKIKDNRQEILSREKDFNHIAVDKNGKAFFYLKKPRISLIFREWLHENIEDVENCQSVRDEVFFDGEWKDSLLSKKVWVKANASHVGKKGLKLRVCGIEVTDEGPYENEIIAFYAGYKYCFLMKLNKKNVNECDQNRPGWFESNVEVLEDAE